MTNVKEFLILESIKAGIFPVNIQNCYEENSTVIENITSVFDSNSVQNNKILENACKLICSLFNNFDDINSTDNSLTEEDKLFAFTSFIRNIDFFYMCWNLLIVNKFYDKKEHSRFINKFSSYVGIRTSVYKFQAYKAAGSEGLREFGERKILEGLGSIGQMCDSEDGEYQFFIELEESAVNQKFKMEIEFYNGNQKYNASIVSNGDGESMLRSDTIVVKDIFQGISDLVITISLK